MQVRKLPKVNAGTHVRLQAATMEAPGSRKGDAAAAAAELLEDDRFAALFDDEDFAVDERSRTFKELNPNAGVCWSYKPLRRLQRVLSFRFA